MTDLLLLLILVLTVILSYQRGALASLSGLGSYLLAVFVTSRYTSAVADFLYEKVVRNIAIDRIKSAIFNGSAYHEGNKWFDYVQEASKMSTKASDMAEYITDQYLSNVLLQMTSVVVSVLLFVILSTLVSWLLGLLIKTLHRTKGVGTLDRILGGVLGVVKGGLLIAALALALSYLRDSGWDALPESVQTSLDNSYLVTLVQDYLVIGGSNIVQPR